MHTDLKSFYRTPVWQVIKWIRPFAVGQHFISELPYRYILNFPYGKYRYFQRQYSGCESGSSDPYLWLTDSSPDPAPDPALFVSDLQEAKKTFFSVIFYACSPDPLHGISATNGISNCDDKKGQYQALGLGHIRASSDCGQLVSKVVWGPYLLALSAELSKALLRIERLS